MPLAANLPSPPITFFGVFLSVMHRWHFAAEVKSPGFGTQHSSICLTVSDMALLSVRLQYLWECCKSSERERKVLQEGLRGKIDWDERGKD